jgi:hypothetical protein
MTCHKCAQNEKKASMIVATLWLIAFILIAICAAFMLPLAMMNNDTTGACIYGLILVGDVFLGALVGHFISTQRMKE